MIRYVLLVLAMCAAVLSPVAPVQAAVQSPLSILNKIIMNTPGISSVSVGGSTTVSGAAAESVGLSSGLRIPVPISASASIGSSALADIAATAMKGGIAIGLASIAIPLIVDATGIYVCPPPDFFCKPDPNGPSPSDLYGAYVAGYPATTCLSQSDRCSYLDAAKAQCRSSVIYTTGVAAPNPSNNTLNSQWRFYFSCTSGGSVTYVVAPYVSTCPSGYYLKGGQCIKNGATVPGVPATKSEISAALGSKMASSGANQQAIYDAARADGLPVFTGSEPVTVSAPPVTTQPQTRSEQIDNGDGTTSTKTITTQTTVTPQVSGNTISNTTITYPAQTTVTTTITNNTTNVSTTTTTIINENAMPQTPSEKTDLPTDYARDASVRQLDRDLNADGAPALPDQEGRITAKDTEVETAMQSKRDAIVAGKSDDQNLFYKWLWTPPVGSCSATTGTVHGWTVGFDICPTVEMIRDCLGWLQALFTAITVYGLLFRQGD